MKIAIAGGTGFIGKHLIPFFLQHNDSVILISRRMIQQSSSVETVTWAELETDTAKLEGVNAIVNLAGESINQRWTPAAKSRILQSRLDTAARIASVVDRLDRKPSVVVNASGMSIYGTSETDVYDETSPKRITDFLAETVDKWEAAIDQIRGTRVVKVRVGVVLGNDGGAFPKMALPYKLWVGGRLGSGRQVLSWIHIEDMVRLIDFCIRNEQIVGPVNGTAPNPVTNDEFGRALGRAMGRPHYFPVPAWMFKICFGELSVLLLEGQRVIPRVLMDQGFQFRYPTIERALAQLVKGERSENQYHG
jgi:hypothetical protein